MKTISEQLSAARRAKGYTQERFAEMLHVSRQAVSHWENGRATPDIETLHQIARLLEAPSLLAPEDSQPSTAIAPQVAVRCFPALQKLLPVAALALTVAFILSLILPRTRLRAEIVITPETPVAYLQRHSEILWDVMFSFANITDVPFHPECIIASFYTNEQLGESLVVMAEDLRPYMGGDSLRRDYQPLRMPIGTTRPYYTRIVCTLYGTDENGHLLRFEGECTLKYEYAPKTL